MMGTQVADRAAALESQRRAYVEATVVRAARPASVQVGATALVLSDGTIEGFVGGHCAEPAVRLHALHVLETGEPLLLRIEPGAGDEATVEGAVTVHNPCISGGALEIFLEPHLPAARIRVLGETPIAAALTSLAGALGFEAEAGEPSSDDAALVVASHGRDEEEALAVALDLGVPYVGLVASRKRGTAVVGSLTVADDDKARVHTPAGLDIGARTPEEIALSILAEIVATRRRAVTAPAPADETHGGGHCCHG
jgi:xanthine dehydrogenase accessory factor